MPRASTFTTYFNTRVSQEHERQMRAYTARVVGSYDAIARAAERANRASGTSVSRGFAAANDNRVALTNDRISTSSQRVTRDLGRQRGATASLATENTRLERSLRATSIALNVVQGPLGPMAGRVTAIATAFSQLTGAALGFAGLGATIFAGARIADQYAQIEGRLRPLFDSQTDVNNAFREVVGIAARTRTALEPIGDLYVRIRSTAEEAGVAAERAGRITQIAAQAAALSGGSAQSQSAGLGQFAQAFGSGNLAGEELRSIREGTFRLAQAIAEGLGVGVGELKELGAQGVLTSEVIAEALERSARQIEAEFERLPLTINRAAVGFSNALLVTIGRIDQTLGVSSQLAESIAFVGENLGTLITLAVGVAAAFAAIRLGRYIAEITQGTAAWAQHRIAVERTRIALRQRAADALSNAQTAVSGLEREADAHRSIVREVEQRRNVEGRAYREMQPLAERGIVSNYRLAESYGRVQQANFELNNAMLDQRTTTGQLATARAALTTAEINYERQLKRTSTTMQRFRTALGNILNMTNFLTAAFYLGVTALAAYANRATIAEQAIRGLTDEQRRLWDATHETNRELRQQSELLARQDISEARSELRTQRSNLVDSVGDVAELLRELPSFSAESNSRDERRLRAIADALENNPGNQLRELLTEALQIAGRHPVELGSRQFGRFGETYEELLTRNIGEIQDSAFGVRAQRQNMAEAQEDLRTARNYERRDALGLPQPLSAARLEAEAYASADARARAETQARNDFNAERQRIRGEYVTGGRVNPEDRDAFIRETAANRARLEERLAGIREERAAAADARSDAAAGRAAERRELAEINRQRAAAERLARESAQRAERRTDILGRYASQPTAATQAADQVDDLQRMVGQQVNGVDFIGRTRDEVLLLQESLDEATRLGRGIYTQEQANRDKAHILDGLRRPLDQVFEEFDRLQELQMLRLNGWDAEAAALERAISLYDDIGQIDSGTLTRLIEEEERQLQINEALESRQRIIETTLSTVANVRDAFADMLVDLGQVGPRAIVNFWNTLRAGYSRAIAQRISEDLFGGAQDRVRELVRGTGGVERAAEYLAEHMAREAERRQEQTDRIGSITGALGDALDDNASALDEHARALEDATARINGTATAGQPGLPDQYTGMGGPLDDEDAGARSAFSWGNVGVFPGRDAAAQMAAQLQPVTRDIENALSQFPDFIARSRSFTDANQDIIVEAITNKVPSVKDTYTTIFDEFGANLDDALGTNFFAGMGKSFSGALAGAGRGAFASGIADALGIKQSGTGAQLGGALGSFLPFPGGDIVGGLIGGTLGGLLKKTPSGSANIDLDDFGNLVVGTASGNKDAAIKVATDAIESVIGQITQIADALGGVLAGAPVGSLGVRGEDYRFDPTGQGRTKGSGVVDFGEDLEAAIAYMVRLAIEQGVIGGISQASQNILKSGQDLQVALEKALIIESIPKRLLEKTDPVRYAVEELNREFTRMISILKEAGATDAQFADAAKLYELERAEAIEEANQRAASSIQEYLDELTRGSESPFSRRQTYVSAQAAARQFEADILSGKRVDEEKLLDAARDFEAASETLYGSREQRFTDLEWLMNLLEKARDNSANPASGPLPESPFANDADVQAAIARANGTQVGAINQQTNALAAKLDGIHTLLERFLTGVGGFSGGGSLLGSLPGSTLPQSR